MLILHSILKIDLV
jgi:hypothetical protein